MSFTVETAKGKTSRKWFGMGYQSAMDDIARELAAGGPEAVVEWLRNNHLSAARIAGLDATGEPIGEPPADEDTEGDHPELAPVERFAPMSDAEVTRKYMPAKPAAALSAHVPMDGERCSNCGHTSKDNVSAAGCKCCASADH
jgi:hypothetical protein